MVIAKNLKPLFTLKGEAFFEIMPVRARGPLRKAGIDSFKKLVTETSLARLKEIVRSKATLSDIQQRVGREVFEAFAEK